MVALALRKNGEANDDEVGCPAAVSPKLDVSADWSVDDND